MRRFLFATAIVAAAAIATPLAADEPTITLEVTPLTPCTLAEENLYFEELLFQAQNIDVLEKIVAQEERIWQSLSAAEKEQLNALTEKLKSLRKKRDEIGLACVNAEIAGEDATQHIERLNELEGKLTAVWEDRLSVVGPYIQNDE